MKVKLLNYTKDAEETIAKAGKLSYSDVGVDEISEKLTEDNIDKYISMLIRMGHFSPLEHVSFTFAVEGVSRVLTHQLVRHRIASYSQQSQRYVKLENFEYIVPPEIVDNETAREIFIKSMEEDAKSYEKLSSILFETHYKRLLDEGVSETKASSQAEKLAIEDARYLLPNSCETKIVFTMNARTLLHFFSLRCCNRSQWEIREMATKMVEILKPIYPSLFKNAGPNCLERECPEGKMSCGKMAEVREKFHSI